MTHEAKCPARRLRIRLLPRGKSMNFQQHFIPASIAATAHFALLLSGGTPYTPTKTTPEKPPEEVVYQFPVDLSEPPPADPPTSEVKELKGEPPPPELPEPMNMANAASIPVEIAASRITPESMKDRMHLAPPGSIDGQIDGQLNAIRAEIVDISRLDKIPRAKSQLPPNYPSALKRDKIDGEVLVEFDVDAKGRVVGARVKRSSDRAFNEPTIQAVMKWRFEPGLSKGMPVPFRMMVPVSFSFAKA